MSGHLVARIKILPNLTGPVPFIGWTAHRQVWLHLGLCPNYVLGVPGLEMSTEPGLAGTSFRHGTSALAKEPEQVVGEGGGEKFGARVVSDECGLTDCLIDQRPQCVEPNSESIFAGLEIEIGAGAEARYYKFSKLERSGLRIRFFD